MKKGGRYRFTIQFPAHSESQLAVGELLEKLGNKKALLLLMPFSSTYDIAAILNISRTRVYQLLHEGVIPKICFGQRMIIPRDRFLEWMEKQIQY